MKRLLTIYNWALIAVIFVGCTRSSDTTSHLEGISTSTLCNTEGLEPYIKRFNQVLSLNKNPWVSSFRFEDARFVIRTRSSNGSLAYGFLDDQLAAAGFSAEPCADLRGYHHVRETVPYPDENGIFAIIDGTEEFRFDYYSQNGYPMLAQLSKKADLPLATILLPLSTEIPDDLPDEAMEFFEEYLANIEAEAGLILFHELFHAFQNNWTKPDVEAEREVASICFKNDLWAKSMADEMSDWQKYGAIIPSLPMADAARLAQRLLMRRVQHHDESVRECWKKYGIWEAIEGTARYFEVKLGRASGIFPVERDSRRVIREATVTGFLGAESEGWEPYYGTGDLVCRLISRIAVNRDWQKEIEKGSIPHKVLQSALKDLIDNRTGR